LQDSLSIISSRALSQLKAIERMFRRLKDFQHAPKAGLEMPPTSSLPSASLIPEGLKIHQWWDMAGV